MIPLGTALWDSSVRTLAGILLRLAYRLSHLNIPKRLSYPVTHVSHSIPHFPYHLFKLKKNKSILLFDNYILGFAVHIETCLPCRYGQASFVSPFRESDAKLPMGHAITGLHPT